MSVSSWMHLLSWLALPSALALACGGSGGSGSSIAGTPCDPMCAGIGCNMTCDGDLVFACDEIDAVWRFEENCRARGQACGTSLLGGGPGARVGCMDAMPDGGENGGSGGVSTTGGSGGTGGRVQGSVQITFAIEDSGAYCTQADSCDTTPAVSITNAVGEALTLSAGWCPTFCADCTPQPCPGLACMPRGVVVDGARLDWDGTYYESGTCGGGTACISPRYAPPGAYTARFCATRGSLETSSTTGEAECVVTGERECVSVGFDFPTSGTAQATLPGAGGAGGAGGVGGTAGSGAIGGGTECAGADANGFFDSCSACPSSDCDTLVVGSSSRSACGCSSSGDCPCGFTCGSYEVAPGVGVGGICVR